MADHFGKPESVRGPPLEGPGFLLAWAILVVSMMAPAILLVALGGGASLLAGARWSEITQSAGFVFAVICACGVVAGLTGPFYLLFLTAILKPRPPYLRWGYWVFVAGPGLPFAAYFMAEVLVPGLPFGGPLDPGMWGAAYEILVLLGTLTFVAIGRPLGFFEAWPASGQAHARGASLANSAKVGEA
jgi:hypothetical protein